MIFDSYNSDAIFSPIFQHTSPTHLIGEAKYASLIAILSTVNAQTLFYAVIIGFFVVPMFLKLKGGCKTTLFFKPNFLDGFVEQCQRYRNMTLNFEIRVNYLNRFWEHSF